MALNKTELLRKIDAAMQDAAQDAAEETMRFETQASHSRSEKAVRAESNTTKTAPRAPRTPIAK